MNAPNHVPAANRTLTLGLAVWLMVLGAWVWNDAQSLPSTVASHFNAQGVADGHMPRDTYAALMAGLVLGVPLLVAGMAPALRHLPDSMINLPHKSHWLSAAQREATLGYLAQWCQVMAGVMAGFMAYVHHILAQANRLPNPQLELSSLWLGMAVLVSCLSSAIFLMRRRFQMPHPAP